MINCIEIDSVQKTIGGKKVLSDIYLKINSGEIISLTGNNGTGKSTLLKIIFGTMPADQKFIRINGTPCNKPYTLPHTITYLPQHPFIPSQLRLHKAVSTFIGKQLTSAFLQDPFLQPLANAKIADLSGGELRYLETKLILNKPSMFTLLDEPFNKLSPILVEQLKNDINIAAHHKGILISNHQQKHISDISHRHYILHEASLKEVHITS